MAKSSRLKPASIITADDLLRHDLPPRDPVLELVVAPPEERTVVSAGNIVEVIGATGTGKSFFATGLALAISTGTRFLHWRAPKPRKVLYCDFEMAIQSVQSRIRTMMATMAIASTNQNLAILSQDLQDVRLPRLDFKDEQLTKVAGHYLVEPLLNWQGWTTEDEAAVHSADEATPWKRWGGSVLILDNAACLFDPASEMEIESWQAAQDWLLDLRRLGITVVLIHHMGRQQGQGRGISAREDAMDVILHLNKPDLPYVDGAKFSITFAKGRDLVGKAKEDVAEVICHKKRGWGFKLKKGMRTNSLLTDHELCLMEHLATSNLTQAELLDKVHMNEAAVKSVVGRLREWKLVRLLGEELSCTPRGGEVVKHYRPVGAKADTGAGD